MNKAPFTYPAPRPAMSEVLITDNAHRNAHALAKLHRWIGTPLAIRRTQILRGPDGLYLVEDIECSAAVLCPCDKAGVPTGHPRKVALLTRLKSPFWMIHRADQRGFWERLYARFIRPRELGLVVVGGWLLIYAVGWLLKQYWV